ncbi:MAG: hypothetical protein ACR2QR_06060 [Woeseiaceae bacterium]
MRNSSVAFLLAALLNGQSVFAQDLNPDNYTTANIYYHVGAVSGLGETIKYDLKKIGLSAPMPKDVIDTYEPIFQHAIERQGIKYYREDDFLVTDMFPEERTNGKILLVIYKNDDVLEAYFNVKKYKQELIDSGEYDLAARREVATRFGKLLSYHDEQIEFFLKRSGLH